MKNIVRALFVALLLIGLRPASGADVLVFAAASLTDALQEIARDYEERSADKVRFSFGASSVLARQIQEGARADLFFSADEEKMDQLQNRGLVKNETRKSLLSNKLVVVILPENKFSMEKLADLQKAKRVAVAEPSTVPAGIYARRSLEAEGVWKGLNIVPTENVRAALLAVESGNVEAAIVYKTDAAISKKVKVAYEVAPLPDVKISYPVALMKEGRNSTAAKRFLDHLESPAAAKIFVRHGFIVIADGPIRPKD